MVTPSIAVGVTSTFLPDEVDVQMLFVNTFCWESLASRLITAAMDAVANTVKFVTLLKNLMMDMSLCKLS
ncbi:unnamed protein product [Ambrosiozyma monospora]|uniref:Unnamed protein product n=1 Tax=Ambrosiozyma monospora TaxID=43982 RepID=A0ACB5T2T5_AMBMO|nr:unnamed protein product [Ambrosiozyma monospora]